MSCRSSCGGSAPSSQISDPPYDVKYQQPEIDDVNTAHHHKWDGTSKMCTRRPPRMIHAPQVASQANWILLRDQRPAPDPPADGRTWDVSSLHTRPVQYRFSPDSPAGSWYQPRGAPDLPHGLFMLEKVLCKIVRNGRRCWIEDRTFACPQRLAMGGHIVTSCARES